MILRKINPLLILLSISLFLISGCGSSGTNEGGGGLGVDPPVGLFESKVEINPPFIEFSFTDENGRISSPHGLVLVIKNTQTNLWFSADIEPREPPDMIGVFDTKREVFPDCQMAGDVCRIVLNTAPNVPPGSSIPPVLDAQPRGITFDPFDNKLWIAEFGTGVIALARGRDFFEYPIKTPDSGPLGISLDLSNGMVWFTENRASQIGRLDPSQATGAPGVGFEEFHVCEGPTGIDVHQGKVWFTCPDSNQIGMLDSSDSFNTTYYQLPTDSGPTGIAVDTKSNMVWFSEFDGNKIGRLDISDPTQPQISEYELPNDNSFPQDLAIDPETGKIWFTEYRGNRIGSLDPEEADSGPSDGFTEYDIPTPNSGPTSILVDSDGSIWFSETAAQKIGKLTPL